MGSGGKQLIIKAEFNPETKEVDIDIYTKHIPTLSHLAKVLDYEIVELMAQAKMKREASSPVIHAAGSIINRLRRK